MERQFYSVDDGDRLLVQIAADRFEYAMLGPGGIWCEATNWAARNIGNGWLDALNRHGAENLAGELGGDLDEIRISN